MLRQMFNRAGALALVVAVIGLALVTTSCGGSSGQAAKPMVLLEFLFVDRSLQPTAPTGTENLPRNAQLLMVFSELVSPRSVNNQTIQVRFGPTGQSVPLGSFSVDGNTVRFDPTVTAQGQPNPFGFLPVTQYLVDIPSYDQQQDVIRNLDDDPNLDTFFTTFVTSDGYLRELVPPEIVRVYSIPDRFEVNPLTGQWPGNGIMAFEFSEPMAPASFVLGGPGGPDEFTTIDVRYDLDAEINIASGIAGLPIPGFFTVDPSATTFFFNPTFSFGDQKYVFNAQVFQGLRDLSGNLLVNPRSFGDYTCDGRGQATGQVLEENFLSFANIDYTKTDADWGATEEGVLQGQAITSRNAYIFGWQFQDADGDGNSDDLARVGQYSPLISPLIGAALNQFVSNITPPTSQGRRVLWAFSDTEMGDAGTVTGAAWGPDSNATFAAIYPQLILRCGFQKQSSMNLSPDFVGNYEGTPLTVFSGEYRVPQAANVGDTVPEGNNSGDPADYSINPGCNNNHNAPLFNSTGFQPWPAFSTYFDWEPGDPIIDNDRVFLFDASADEGDTWQQLRGWFAVTYPCSGILINGYPNRRMYTTFEGETPNPLSNFAAGILNPEPSMSDTSFTITKRVSVAQVLFYTDGNQPTNSVARTLGKESDYLPFQLTPQVQTGGATVRVEFNACDAVEADRRTVNQTAPFLPGWTETIDDCDGFANIRWRIALVSNLISGRRARLTNVALPLVRK